MHLGRVTKYFSKLQVAELELNAGELSVGNEIRITSGTTGALRFEVETIKQDYQNVTTATKDTIVTIPVPRKVRLNDKLYIFKTRRFGNTPQTGQVV